MSDTREIKFGTFLTDPTRVVAQARRGEELGYDLLACGEHITFNKPVPNSFISLACAAGVTQRVKLMNAIALLPLYSAALAAKLGAALDAASDGRFIFGVGVGGEIPREFEASGVPVGERGARTNEALQIIKRLWSEESVSFEGRFNTLNKISIAPPPVQRPHPPIWVAGRQDAAARRAGRYGDGWLPYMFTPEQFAESLAKVKRFAEEAGRNPDNIEAGLLLWSNVQEDGARAHQAATDYLSRNYAQDFTKLVPRYALAGDPDTCRARVQEFIDAGASLVILAPASDGGAETDRNVEFMADTVVAPMRG
ncbi:MAG: LLM class flavin-dependent oxidoreductase [Hyphomicrobiaceae bacterium]